MTQYMLSVHTGAREPREPMTDEQQRQGYARIAGLESEMEAADAFVLSARLSEASEAKVVRRGPGRPKSTDGPFAETKEHLGGFYLIEAPDIAAAMEWASRVSDAIGEPIEVRPLAGSRSR
ncbi:MAG: YciI family protein [Chloroflexota bacterium]